jgi:outer membrane protein OmpA-like peptidoglycan-associated protein
MPRRTRSTEMTMKRLAFLLAIAIAAPALGASPWDLGKKAVGGAATAKLEAEINKRLLFESRKNQCSFKTNTADLAPGCDPKARQLANSLVEAKKRLNSAGVQNFKFEVSGHTDSVGDAEHNKDLSRRRAEAMKRELVKKGIPEPEIVAVGMGFERPQVKPDNTPAKKAKNRRYEVQVRL